MDKRSELSCRYIRGRGIEIGALHQPLQVSNNVNVKYVDRLNNDDLLHQYPELKGLSIVSPDIIDNAEKLDNIEDEKYDFCICNHVVEHMADPICAFKSWFRVLKPGGILYISIPDVNNNLDVGRELTTLEHLIDDNTKRDCDGDYAHFVECAKYWNDTSDKDNIENIARKNWNMQYSIHYHTFSKHSIENFFSYLKSILEDKFQTLDSTENDINGTKEYIYIIEKTNYVDKICDILCNSEKCKQSRCDIIIPVYNAYLDVIRCIYSVLKYQEGYRVICINDKSTDPRIGELFSRMKSFENENIVLLDNPENLGFIKTVNKGMEFSKNDVVLLNSDAIVTDNWVAKLVDCAYSSDRIATTTPFSNNATICSVPNFCQDNIIPEGFTIDTFSDFIERISLRQYPEIPTAVGFCMYIKRDIINEIGYFDNIFGKGYGEENDFCIRAIKSGYKNVLCDDTFIFHKGTASFSETKKPELVRKNLEILSKRHPEYLSEVAKFCQSNPLIYIHENVKIRMKTWNCIDKKRILFVLHHLGGGTENHTIDLVKSIGSLYVCYIVQVENNHIILTEYDNGHILRYTFSLSHSTGFGLLYDEEYNRIFRKIINTFNIDLIHIQHLILHTLDIFDIAEEYNIPLFMTLHDYYIVCPCIQLINEKDTYCHKKNNIDICSRCLSKRFKFPNDFAHTWRESYQKAINKCDLLIVPNSSVFEILKEYYDFQNDKTLVIEHGHRDELLEIFKENTLSNLEKSSIGNKFHIAFVGPCVKHKGGQIFYDMAMSKKLKNKIRWSVIGESPLYSNPNVYVHGKYKDLRELGSFCREENVDMVFIPSIWPETFSYVLSEALAFGIPVLVSDMGALEERVIRLGVGWTVDVYNTGEVEKKILEIVSSISGYQTKKESIRKIELKRLKTMVAQYIELYEKKFSLDKITDHNVIFSNEDIISSTTIPKECVSIETGRTCQKDIALHTMLFQCFKENGLIYTIKRVIVYFKNSYIHLSLDNMRYHK